MHRRSQGVPIGIPREGTPAARGQQPGRRRKRRRCRGVRWTGLETRQMLSRVVARTRGQLLNFWRRRYLSTNARSSSASSSRVALNFSRPAPRPVSTCVLRAGHTVPPPRDSRPVIHGRDVLWPTFPRNNDRHRLGVQGTLPSARRCTRGKGECNGV